jgi:AcrR family transcriptional regulator
MATSLRERKKAATRKQLMTVALRLFEIQRFDNTTVEEIAAAADVAPRTFFRYFPTKIDVLFADHPEQIALLRETLASHPPDEAIIDAVKRATLDRISAVVADPSPFLVRSRLVASVPAAQAHSRYLDSEYEGVIAKAVAADGQTHPASDLQARIIARATWGTVCAARETWLESNAKREPPTLVNEAFDLLERGLRPSKRGARTPV